VRYAIAPLYDVLLFPFVRPVRERILHIARKEGYRSIVDLCCGTGDQLKRLHAKGFDVAGVDLSDPMLAVARRGPDPPACYKRDAVSTGFPDASFDAATVTFAIHEKPLETAGAILREMLRLVPVGGQLLIADYHFGPSTGSTEAALVQIIERLAGGEHYRNFRAYKSAGGVYPLLASLPVEHLHTESLGRDVVRIELYRRIS